MLGRVDVTLVRGLLVMFSFGSVSRVHAQPLALPQLEWHAAVSCPDAEAAQRAIARWLRDSVEPVDASVLAVRATIRGAPGAYTLALSLRSASGRSDERFAAERCNTLVEVVALKVALAASAAVVLPAPSLEPQEGPRWALRVMGGVASGELPGVNAEVAAAASLRAAWLRFELGAAVAPASTAHYPELAAVGARVQLWYGFARACASTRLGLLEVPLCAGLELGVLRGEGIGQVTSLRSEQVLAAALFGPALRWPIAGRFALWWEVTTALAFARPRSLYVSTRAGSTLGALYRPEMAAARTLLGIEWTF